jgi:hypothetical protein
LAGGAAPPLELDEGMVDHAQPILDRVGAAPEQALTERSAWVARAREWASRETLLFPVVALFIIGVAGNLPNELFQDGWLVILGGREVVQHGLPSHDALTIWTHGREWVDQQWLAQLLFYGLYALGGVKLALSAHAAFIAAAFTLAIVMARRRGASTRSVCWIAVPVYFLLTWAAWNARAQSLAVLLFVATVALLIRDAHSPSRRVFLVLPLLVLWANIHGTALTGAVLVALWGVTSAVQNRARPLRQWLPRSAALVIAPLACVFASPYAASLPGYYHTMLLNSGFRQFIVEWRPTAPSIQTAPFYLLAFLTVWLIGRKKERLLPFEQVLLGFTLLMGLQTIRSVLWFTLTALMILPYALDGVLKPNTRAMRFPVLNRALVASSVAGVIAVVAVVAAKPATWFDRDYPTGVLTAFDRVQARDAGMKVFADEKYGDWLLVRRPALRGRLAYDIRFELGSKGELRRLLNVKQRVEGWQRTLAPYSLFVLSSDSEGKLAAALLLQPGARREFRGNGAIVISRPAQHNSAR